MKEKNEANSQIEADKLLKINVLVHGLDVEYLREAAKEAAKNASSFAASRRYTPTKSRLLYAQSKALKAICGYHDALKECNKLGAELNSEESKRQELDNLLDLL